MNHFPSPRTAVIVTWLVLLAGGAESRALPQSIAKGDGLPPSPASASSNDGTEETGKFHPVRFGVLPQAETSGEANPVAMAVAASEVLSLAKTPRRRLGRSEFWNHVAYNPAEIVRNHPTRWKRGNGASPADPVSSAGPALAPASVSVPDWLSTSEALAFAVFLMAFARFGLVRPKAVAH